MDNIVENIIINDTTLRDGEQTAGIVFSADEKLLIAKMLDETGVDEIEAGIPIMGGDEKSAVKKINESGLNAKIIGWNRAMTEDIYASLDIGLKFIHVSVPISKIHIEYKLKKNFEYVKNNLINLLKILNKEGVKYSVGGEDSSRADLETIIEIMKIAENEGAYKFRYSDTVGILNPLKIYEDILKIKNVGKFKNILIEIHTHNDFGMAAANSIAALKAGADSVSGSISGIGERAGNCALEEVIGYLNFIESRKIKFDFIKAKKLAKFIAKITKRKIPVYKPIFGRNIFYHEAGIHTDGILKNPLNYEAYTPELTGSKRKLLLGKHGGSAAIKYNLDKLGIKINDEDASNMLSVVKKESSILKRCLTDKELLFLYNHKLK
jgi:homocitrate synthase NifV